jgi:hypothetical protein
VPFANSVAVRALSDRLDYCTQFSYHWTTARIFHITGLMHAILTLLNYCTQFSHHWTTVRNSHITGLLHAILTSLDYCTQFSYHWTTTRKFRISNTNIRTHKISQLHTHTHTPTPTPTHLPQIKLARAPTCGYLLSFSLGFWGQLIRAKKEGGRRSDALNGGYHTHFGAAKACSVDGLVGDAALQG